MSDYSHNETKLRPDPKVSFEQAKGWAKDIKAWYDCQGKKGPEDLMSEEQHRESHRLCIAHDQAVAALITDFLNSWREYL